MVKNTKERGMDSEINNLKTAQKKKNNEVETDHKGGRERGLTPQKKGQKKKKKGLPQTPTTMKTITLV